MKCWYQYFRGNATYSHDCTKDHTCIYLPDSTSITLKTPTSTEHLQLRCANGIARTASISHLTPYNGECCL
jgi:hypothetical protein